MSLQQFDETAPIVVNQLYIHGAATTPTDLFPADTSARRVDSILGTNSDSIDHVVQLFLGTGGFVPTLTRLNIPAGAGVTTSGPIDLLSSLPAPLQAGFVLTPGAHVQAACVVDVSSGAGVVIFGFGGYV